MDEANIFLESCLIKPQTKSSTASGNVVKSCPPIKEESPDIINPEEDGKRKRRRPKEYSPELISSRKRPCYTKEAPSTSTKYHFATSGSTSSREGRHHLSKTAKANSDKRGLDSSGTSKKETPDVVQSTPKEESLLVKSFKSDTPFFAIPSAEEPVRQSKPAIPFALSILPKKNVPVDVEKAFGSDISFLPLSSLNDMSKKIATTSSSATLAKLAVPDKSQSLKHVQVIKPSQVRSETTKIETAAEIIEKQLAVQALKKSVALETSHEGSTSYTTKPAASIISRVVPRPGHAPYIRQSIIAHPPLRGRMKPLTPPEPEDNTVSAEEIENTIGELEAGAVFPPSSAASELPSTSFVSPAPQIFAVSEKQPIASSSEQTSSDSKTISGSIIKHVLTSSPDAAGKLVSTSPASPAIKTVFLKDKALTSSPGSHLKGIGDGNFVARTISQVKSPTTSTTMITVPLNTDPLLVSGQTLKIPPGKIFQFLSKSPVTSQSKEALTPKLVGSPHEASHQVYNISSLNDMSKKIATTLSSATLVKLAVPDKSQSLKHVQVIKPSQVRSETTKIETAAEMIEKQLSIQALKESVSLETSHEGSTSYTTKPASSIISRVVPRPGHAPYIRQSIIAHPPLRGRMRPILPKIYQMYPK